MSEIINRVASSPIVTLNLEDYYRVEERVVFDLKDFLFQELILKEKDFRNALKELDWEKFQGKLVAVTCTADAIVPNWAFMLVGTYLGKLGVEYVIGDLHTLEQYLFEQALSKIDPNDFKDRPVVIKGCSKYPVPLFAYGRVLAMLQNHARSIMYGEPCSTVPIFKAAK
ncbi:DUF2480 family protein [Cecembia calidifontis]|jgi:hypothetical protein|uniref:Uncharacterized protein DUF2480 n=1 Tax=Cecembia calidifontis TaxID=1187080 RepID=A0A4Q7PDH8_9BACT|nr:DUF2480 family protein [Cecembia calidifontis]RZS98424.1 uncharacterized protein DUF2480 [Cecembia calidifontis]